MQQLPSLHTQQDFYAGSVEEAVRDRYTQVA